MQDSVEPHNLERACELLREQARLTPDVVAARIGGEIVDLHTPVAASAKIEPVHIDDPEALSVIRHSASHVMADAVQRLFPGTQVTFGPATETGFFYDFDRPDGQFSEADLQRIEELMRQIIAANQPFERRIVSREEAERLFAQKGEKYKVEHLGRLEGEITLYRHGEWTDLCAGPHAPSTGYIRAFKLTSVAGAYWRGDERNKMLQRIYGTAFASSKALDAYLKSLDEAKKRDHRRLGKDLDLIGFHRLAPASPFFLPRGAQIYNRLIDYLRDLYRKHGYLEVITPQVFESELFEISGHLPGYAENMFLAATAETLEQAVERIVKQSALSEQEARHSLQRDLRYAIKPMNCPATV